MKPTGERQQLRAEDFGDNDSLRRALNDVLLSLQQRLGALEAMGSLYLPEPFVIQTTKAGTAYGTPPFPIRVALPEEITPAGVLLGSIENLDTSGAPATVAHDVKWQVKPGGGGILIRHIPGLKDDTKYLLRLVVIRG